MQHASRRVLRPSRATHHNPLICPQNIWAKIALYFFQKSPMPLTHSYVRSMPDIMFYGDRESRESYLTRTHRTLPYISAQRALHFRKKSPLFLQRSPTPLTLAYVRNMLDVVSYGDRKSRESRVTYTRTKEPNITAERALYFHKKSPVFRTHAYVRAACFDVVFYGDRESRESHVIHTYTQKPYVSANRALCFRKKNAHIPDTIVCAQHA